ncbi:hypothetical protein BH24ACT12_BH24ACT12_16180 [soil metagenome]
MPGLAAVRKGDHDVLHRDLDSWRRPATVVMTPERLGAARPTRHSFAASALRTVVREGWSVERERWTVDGDGVGEVVYRVDTPTDVLRFVVFSTLIDEADRTDRVVASSWDVTAALVDGDLDEARLARLRAQVPRQEQGVADSDSLVWTRGNRSSRFFEHVVSALAAGHQPDAALLGCSPYVIRSTAYYSNGRFGLASYDGVRQRRSVAAPYRAHMVAAWLFREFSCDLVEHLARLRAPSAVRLAGSWRRALGIGNATGLGMVPYVINHPAILDRWVGVRETALAAARSQPADRAAADWPELQHLLARAVDFCQQRAGRSCAPFQDGGSLAAELRTLQGRADRGPHGRHPFDGLWRFAEDAVGLETQELLQAVLTNLDDSLDAELEASLHVPDEPHRPRPGDPVRRLRDQLTRYDWVHPLASARDADRWFWYYARDNEEPRRGLRGAAAGEDAEMPVDVARAVHTMSRALDGVRDDDLVASFLLRHPEHRGAVARVQHHADLPYAEVRDNLLGPDFLPLQLQRFQLAMYGATDFVPQSTDWVRVTLLNGAPSLPELPGLRSHEHDLFPPLAHEHEEIR